MRSQAPCARRGLGLRPRSAVRAQAEGLGLTALGNALERTWAEHGVSGCAAPLRCAQQQRFGVDGLFAYCAACQFFAMVL